MRDQGLDNDNNSCGLMPAEVDLRTTAAGPPMAPPTTHMSSPAMSPTCGQCSVLEHRVAVLEEQRRRDDLDKKEFKRRLATVEKILSNRRPLREWVDLARGTYGGATAFVYSKRPIFQPPYSTSIIAALLFAFMWITMQFKGLANLALAIGFAITLAVVINDLIARWMPQLPASLLFKEEVHRAVAGFWLAANSVTIFKGGSTTSAAAAGTVRAKTTGWEGDEHLAGEESSWIWLPLGRQSRQQLATARRVGRREAIW